jgi:tol-pal system protein YbgF
MRRFMMLVMVSLLTCSCMVSKSDVDTLSARVQDQDQRQRRLEGQLTSLDQELTRLLTELEGVSTPMRATQANLAADIESLRMQTATIQGQVETLQQEFNGDGQGRKDEDLAELRRMVTYLDRSVEMIAGQLAMDLGPRPDVTGDEDDSADLPGAFPPGPGIAPDEALDQAWPRVPDPAELGDPAQALYDRAMQNFQSRNYTQARDLWDEFAKTFPEHDLVANALFWQGECFYQMEDYARAVLAYQDVISKHDQSNKYPAAMLKQGASFLRLGKDRAGVLVLEDLIKKFPDQPESARAKTLLDEQGN